MSPLRNKKALALATGIAFVGLGMSAGTASAHDVRFHKWAHQHGVHQGHFHGHGHRKIVKQRHVYRSHSHGDAAKLGGVVAGILGVAIIADALSKTHAAPAPTVVPQPTYRGYSAYPAAPQSGPKVVYHAQSLEPWTPGWHAWCDERYKTFNHDTGTYRGYDGFDHFCVPK